MILWYSVMDVEHWDEIIAPGYGIILSPEERMELEPDAVLAGALHSSYPISLAGWDHVPLPIARLSVENARLLDDG